MTVLGIEDLLATAGPTAYRVLLIEDDPDDAFLIGHRLGSDHGRFIVDHVDALAGAAERLDASQYDVILLDLGLPDSNGVKTLERLTAMGSSAAVVVLTGDSDPDLSRSSFELGVNDYLPKSAAATELLPRVLIQAVEREAAKSAVAARMAAEKSNIAKSAFLSRISHELRTPLHAIMGFAQLLESEAKTADDLEATGIIVKASEHLLALINDVMDVSQIETGDLALSLERVHLTAVVREAVTMVETPVGAAHIDVLVHDVDGHYVRGDRLRIRQVMINLLSNALKYGRNDGVVTIEAVTHDDGWVEVAVSDEGPGIPAGTGDELFEPFERAHPHGTVEGTGLGLAVSRQLIGAMNGEMGVNSEPGKGARFWFKLPAATV